MPSLRLRAVPVVSLALVAVAMVLAARTPPPRRPPRNVVLISLDTLRADHLGAYGYERDTSPRLDVFAEKSVVFRRAVAQGSSTIPSHASLFTSQYASTVTGLSSGLLDWPETLAEVLSRQGFATWGFVDGGNVRRQFGFDQGFEHYVDDRVGIEKLVRRAKAWIRKNPVPRFFLFLHTYDIHTPYNAPPAYVQLFGDPEYRAPFRPSARYFNWVEKRGRGLPEREHREVVARYDAGIRYTDERVGEFLDWLEERGLLQESVVVLFSDHGEEFLEHGRLGHHQLYLDPNLRVLLLFYRPGLAPRVVEETVELTDVVPTLLDMLELPGLPDAVGRSLVPLLSGGTGAEPRVAYSEMGPSHQTVVSDRYQLLADGKRGTRRLYDLAVDPDARRDVAHARPEVTARLALELEKRRRQAARISRAHHREARRQQKRQPLEEKIRRELEALGYLQR